MLLILALESQKKELGETQENKAKFEGETQKTKQSFTF
jgi:hypothetical protein